MESSQQIKVPYKILINGGVTPGKSFIIRGVVNPSAFRIEFNLRHCFGIAFHYNPRFDQNRVVCNTWDGKWGPEAHPNGMPFKEGQPFEVKIYCTGHRYDVYVNGEQIHSYKHRFLKFGEIDVLDIRGDLQLTYVEVSP